MMVSPERIAGDWVWQATFVQCPKCDGGFHMLQPMLQYDPESCAEFGIEPPFHAPHFILPPGRCEKCGLVLIHEEILERLKANYTMPSKVWVCPNCKNFQAKLMTMIDMDMKVDEGEDWNPEQNMIRTETYMLGDNGNELKCRNCGHQYKIIAALYGEDNNHIKFHLYEIGEAGKP